MSALPPTASVVVSGFSGPGFMYGPIAGRLVSGYNVI